MYSLGDKIITKKKHPCGGDVWKIVRSGADFKIKCEKCGRTVMLTYDELNRRVKKVVSEKDGEEDD